MLSPTRSSPQSPSPPRDDRAAVNYATPVSTRARPYHDIVDAGEDDGDNAGTALQDPVEDPLTFSGNAAAEVNGLPAPDAVTFDGDEDSNDVENNGVSTEGNDSNADAIDDATDSRRMCLPCPKWSEVLSTPSDHAAFTPAADISSMRDNLHGIGLKHAVDRSKSLSRTGQSCASLLLDVATLHDDLACSILKACPTTLDAVSASGRTPLTLVASDAARCVVSFAKQLQGLAICIRNGVARPWLESASSLSDVAPGIYGRYATIRGKCKQAREDALKTRLRYVKCVKEADAAIRVLRRASAKAAVEQEVKPKRGRNGGENNGTTNGALPSPSEQPPQAATVLESSPSAVVPETSSVAEAAPPSKVVGVTYKKGWEDVVRIFGEKRGVSTHSEAVIRALREVQALEAEYSASVEAENSAVLGTQTMERMGLEAAQKLEEERILFLLESLDRLLQAEKGALDNMTLELQVEPLNLEYDGYYNDLSSAPSSDLSSIFMSPKRRTASDDVSAMNETRPLNLPNDVAVSKDNMRSIIGRQATRLKALNLVYAFHEEIASAVNVFASVLHTRLAIEGYARKIGTIKQTPLVTAMSKIEGPRVLSSWNSVMSSLEYCAQSASVLAKKVREENITLSKPLFSAEKDLKASRENEDNRWKFVCDAAKGEAKAKLRLEQCVADLEKARDRLSSMDDEMEAENVEDSKQDVSKLPFMKKKMMQSVKMEQNMNKAMGKMFSILPGGGEDVMAKVLKPEQRLAIAKRSADDLVAKEAKETKSLEVADGMRKQAIASYRAETATAESVFKDDEIHVWSLLQKSLLGSICAIAGFRDSRYNRPTIETNQGRAIIFADMTDWTKLTEKRIKKYLSQNADKKKAQVGRGAVAGFSLLCVLENSKDVEGLVTLVLEDTNEAPGSGLEGSNIVRGSLSESEADISLPNRHPLVSQNLGADKVSLDEPAIEAITPSPDTSIRSVTPSMVDSTEPVETLDGATADSEVVQMFKSFADAFMPTSSRPTDEDSAGESGSVASGQASDQDAVAVLQTTHPDTEVFLSHFWENEDGETNPPTVIQSFSCAYWPKEGEGYISPLLHGRMFVTSPAMYFIGWGEHKIKLNWEDAISATKESTMMGTIDNAIRITFNSDEGVSAYFFGSFAYRDNAFQLANKMITISSSLKQIKGNEVQESKLVPPASLPPASLSPASLPSVPDDSTLKKMDPIFSNKIKNVSIKKYYDIGWSEGNGTDAAPLYEPWLGKKDSFDITVGEWQLSDSGFKNAWSGETFPQKRVIKFKFKRTSHLYIGPPIAGVTQTQYCVRDGNDKCILMMTVEMDGIPYADSFAVEVRWVARRVGINDIIIDSGVFVRITKSNMFSKKIKNGTVAETKPIHDDLFETIKSALASAKDGPADLNEESEEDVSEDVSEDVGEEPGGNELEQENVEGPSNNSVSQIVVDYIGIVKNDQSLLAGGLLLLLFVVLRMTFNHFKPKHSAHEVDMSLVQKVDHLSSEVNEMKIMLEKVLLLVGDAKSGEKCRFSDNNY